MKNTVSFEHISSIEKIVKKYFPSNNKLYCLTKNDITQCGATHDIDIIYIFNDKTWLDVWNNFDPFEMYHVMYIKFYPLNIPTEYYRKKQSMRNYL